MSIQANIALGILLGGSIGLYGLNRGWPIGLTLFVTLVVDIAVFTLILEFIHATSS